MKNFDFNRWFSWYKFNLLAKDSGIYLKRDRFIKTDNSVSEFPYKFLIKEDGFAKDNWRV